MKKLFLLTFMVLTALAAMAQTKKVAILEVVDKEGKLSYNQKLMLRSNIARAVSNTNGYEAYDRSDIDLIMSEHEFQRTGIVNPDQIQQLGEMAGVSLILVTEGVLTNESKIFVTAKILNVETARVEIMDNITMAANSDAIQDGCITLTKRLFGITASSNAIEKYNVERYGANEYVYMGKYMNGKEFEFFLRNNCPKACHQYKFGKQLITAGWSIFGGGLALTVVGATLMGSKYADDAMMCSGLALVSIGPICVGAGVPLLTVGYIKRDKAYKIYNEQCASSSAITFNLTAGQNGLGIAMQF